MYFHYKSSLKIVRMPELGPANHVARLVRYFIYWKILGGKHTDRDAQFQHIANQVAQYQAAGDPVISVDTKKKELIGDFKNGGHEWQPQGNLEEVRVYGFIDPVLALMGCTIWRPTKDG
jgi:hypothetical protein